MPKSDNSYSYKKQSIIILVVCDANRDEKVLKIIEGIT